MIRFLSFILDNIIYFSILFGITIGILIIFFSSDFSVLSESGFIKSLTFFFYVVIIFMFQWGYYFALEMIFNGKTPGKMMLRLRAINYEGEYLDFKSCFVRNFFRVFDVYMTFCLGAFFCMIFNKDFRRIGDLAANTVVIREPRFNIKIPDFKIVDVKNEPLETAKLTQHLSEKELYIIRQFLNSIDKFALEKRNELASRLAKTVSRKLNDTESTADPVEYLKSVYMRHKDE